VVDAVGPALVLKLGGSLAESGRIAGLVEIVTTATYPVVVVPGGAMLADAVRKAQAPLAISDHLAHKLALLSLHQMALVLSAKHPRFETVETLRDIARALLDGSVPVWMPYRLQHDDLGLPADWSATSDALAARLAERMGCGQVALVKSCPVNATADLDQLAQDGITDPTFASVVRRAGLKWAVYGAGDEGAVAARLGCANGEGRTNGSDINGRA
jgi:aspartokinase-like uncharacterized kinase